MRYLLVATFCFLGIFAKANEQPTSADANLAPITDPAIIRSHHQELLTHPEFKEPDELDDDVHFRDWIMQWLTRMISQFQNFKYAGQMSSLAWLLVTGLTGLAIVGLIYVLVRLSRRKGDEPNGENESIESKNSLLSPQVYDERLRQAVENRDWQGAWMATWLQFLSRLETRRMVEADRSRTNREYLLQLKVQQLPEPALPLLVQLVDDYDRFIYGSPLIDEPRWNGFRQQIDEVSLMLHLRANVSTSPEKLP